MLLNKFEGGFMILIIFLFPLILLTQTSPNYQNKEYVFNNGSNPQPVISSSDFKITLSSIGDGIFYLKCLLLTIKFTLDLFHRAPEKSVGTYELYRGNLIDLPFRN